MRDFGCDVVRPSIQTLGEGEGEGGPKATRRECGARECHLFLAENRAVLLGNSAFFLAGNRMSTFTFVKELFFKAQLV